MLVRGLRGFYFAHSRVERQIAHTCLNLLVPATRIDLVGCPDVLLRLGVKAGHGVSDHASGALKRCQCGQSLHLPT